MKALVPTFILALGLTLATSAFAENEGTAVGVDPAAVAKAGGGERVLQMGDDISVGELIVTGASGQVQIVFADNTRLVVGPGSSLKIETYLMANANTAQKLAINALGGSFRFISGNSPKSAYSINTPTASIAVRGTKFDILVERGQTGVLLYEGALSLCASGSACVDVTDRCEVGVAGGQAELFTLPDPERQPLSLQFRYARFQSGLLSAFRVSGATKCTEAFSGPGTPQSIATQPTFTTPPVTRAQPKN